MVKNYRHFMEPAICAHLAVAENFRKNPCRFVWNPKLSNFVGANHLAL